MMEDAPKPVPRTLTKAGQYPIDLDANPSVGVLQKQGFTFNTASAGACSDPQFFAQILHPYSTIDSRIVITDARGEGRLKAAR